MTGKLLTATLFLTVWAVSALADDSWIKSWSLIVAAPGVGAATPDTKFADPAHCAGAGIIWVRKSTAAGIPGAYFECFASEEPVRK